MAAVHEIAVFALFSSMQAPGTPERPRGLAREFIYIYIYIYILYIGVRDCHYGICCPWCVEDGTWMLWENSSAAVVVAAVVVAAVVIA